MPIALLIADNHEVVRQGLRGIFEGTEIRVVGETTSGEATLAWLRERRPDLVMLDVRMPGGDGLSTLGRIKLQTPELPVLMFSAYNNPFFIARAVALGASGYLLKGEPREAILNAVRVAADRGEAWTPEQLRFASSALATPRFGADVEVSLTQREGEVLKQASLGCSNREIAEALQISTETVKEHIRSILHKIGVSDRTQAAVWAVRRDLL